MICKYCGATLDTGERFCQSCGRPTTAQPSREEIRARVRGGGRHAAQTERPAPRRAAPVDNSDKLGPQHTPLLCMVAGLLGVLQIVYLLVKSVYVTLGNGQEGLSVSSYSLVAALRQESSSFLAAALVVLALVLLGSIALPMILSGRPRPLITAGVSILMLVLLILATSSVKSAFSANYMGAKPRLGLAGWLLYINCVLIPAVVFLAGQMSSLEPEEEPAPAPAARRSVQLPQQPAPKRSLRPAAPAKNVTPPDAETIAALRRMAQMHKQGLVSDEEFARIKAECVARGWIRE